MVPRDIISLQTNSLPIRQTSTVLAFATIPRDSTISRNPESNSDLLDRPEHEARRWHRCIGGREPTWTMPEIVRDQDVRSGDPCIEGTRISVFDVKRRVVDNGEDPHVVAGEYDVSMAELFTALAYYYEHRGELRTLEGEDEAVRRDGERRTRGLFESTDSRAEHVD